MHFTRSFLSYRHFSLSLLGRFRLTFQTTSETGSGSQQTVALYFSSIAKPSDLLMQEHVIEWLRSLLRTYLTNVCRGLLSPSDTKWAEMPSSAPKNKKSPEAWDCDRKITSQCQEISLTRTTATTDSLLSSSPTAHKNSN
jgi:hypothetical protein